MRRVSCLMKLMLYNLTSNRYNENNNLYSLNSKMKIKRKQCWALLQTNKEKDIYIYLDILSKLYPLIAIFERILQQVN